MLILTRHTNERVKITATDGSVIWITLVEIKGNERARLGFVADRSVKIDREEIAVLREAESVPQL